MLLSQLPKRIYNPKGSCRAFDTITRTVNQPVKRWIHSKPKEYNGINNLAHHFKQQDHFSYFLKYMMWTVFGSTALHLTWRKMEYKEYKEKTQHKVKVLQEIVQTLERGEVVDENLRNEIRTVLRNEASLLRDEKDDDEEEEEKSILVKLLESSSPKTEPSLEKEVTSEETKEEGKWFEQKTPVYL
ncbi:hypothetical protein RMATCC62417_02008 [Rhizopus microsporus]|nr:hypothetical protein RMATCC62417_02008 [Rhizopus microsporus]